MNTMKAISLFSGMGGDTLGMEQAGFECVAFNEFNSSCVAVHQDNFPHSTFLHSNGNGDIQKIPDSVFQTFPDIDLVFAGFPCQGFSHAGKKDVADPRNRLFYEFKRVVSLVRPRWMIGENVPGLLSRTTDDKSMKIIEKIQQEFEEIGYTIRYQVLHAVSFGVPQTRKRLFIVGFRDSDDALSWSGFPKSCSTSSSTGATDLSSIILPSLSGALRFTNQERPDITTFDTLRLPESEFTRLAIAYNETAEIGKAHPYLKRKLADQQISYEKRISATHSQILNLLHPCKTLISTYCRMPRLYVSIGCEGNPSAPRFIRALLPDEGKQIQGFPPSFRLDAAPSLTAQWTMIGNAVPPPLVRELCLSLLPQE